MKFLRRPEPWLFSVAALLFASALGFGFVWDDENNLVSEARLRDWSALWTVFLKPAMWSAGVDANAPPTYRPLALASFVLDYKLYGGAAWGFHLTSVLLHALAVLAVLGLLRRWVEERPAVAIALLFAVHPVAVPVAGWINGRSEVLALVFGALALRAASGTPSPLRSATVAGLLLLALLGKETGGIFVPLAVLAAGLPERPGIGATPMKLRWDAVLAGVLAVACWLALRGIALEGARSLTGGGSWAKLASVASPVAFRGLQAVVAPLDRAPVPLGAWLNGLDATALWAYGAAGLCLLGVGLWLLLSRRWLLVLTSLWWFGSQAAVPLLALVDWPGHYRWLYTGLPGLGVLAWAATSRLPSGVARGLVAAAALLFAGLTARALPAWESNPAFYVAMAEEHPHDPHGHLGVAIEYARRAHWADAERSVARARELGADGALVWATWAESIARQGRCGEAQQKLRFYPDEAPGPQMDAVEAMGDCYFAEGNLGAARRAYAFCAPRRPRCAARAAAIRGPDTPRLPPGPRPDGGSGDRPGP